MVQKLFGWFLPARCSRCNGNVFIDDVFKDEDGSDMVDITCLHCSRSKYMTMKEYKEWEKHLQLS